MSQIIEIKTEKKNVATQTREIDTMLEIARLQEQVKLLTIEINHLRKYSVENCSMIQTPEKNSNNIVESPIDNETLQKNSQSEKIERKNSKIISRGCNCKGKCSSKICGCVKKNNQCQEWCKCNNDICQNQEHKDEDQNKENLKHNESYEHMENQIINKNTSYINAHKSLFSPNITIQEVAFNVDQYKPPVLYFGDPKELKFVSDEEEQKEKKNEKLKKIENKNDKKKIKTKKNNFDINNSKNIQRSKSISNEKKQGENNIEIRKRALRSCTSNEIQINKEFKHIKKQTNNYVQNVMNGMVTLRHKKKRAEDKNIKKTINTDISKEEVTPFSVEDMKEISSNKTNEISNLFVEEINSHEIDICNENKSHDKDSDNDFNPMKPKHEIPRTPIHSPNQNMTIPCNISDTSLVISTNCTIKEQEQYEDPVEFSYAQVDWEEYQSQLVTCNKCKRKFHPLRIKKHESCCKKL
ncbi:uncharacterized protein LOC102678797 isoform X1 [Apis dorsata]|uniref:uncharacterized protein LOC102678797 isoform X1 n=1 Tax=Apis dorsata TaxID=7462 RepID=UPI0012938E98|nr:uncharacterized protein LOC102678797 isoform X1 [Apis dorsata]